MKRFLLPCLLLLLAAQDPSPKGHPVALTHVMVIDVTGAASQPDMTVIISGDRIVKIEKRSRAGFRSPRCSGKRSSRRTPTLPVSNTAI